MNIQDVLNTTRNNWWFMASLASALGGLNMLFPYLWVNTFAFGVFAGLAGFFGYTYYVIRKAAMRKG